MPKLLGETAYRRQAEDIARDTLGYKIFHPPNCKTRSGAWSSAGITGWPDTTFLRPARIVYVEFKGVATPTTAKQIETLDLLRECGAEVFFWREGTVTLEEIANYLRPKDRPSHFPPEWGSWEAEREKVQAKQVDDALARYRLEGR